MKQEDVMQINQLGHLAESFLCLSLSCLKQCFHAAKRKGFILNVIVHFSIILNAAENTGIIQIPNLN